MDEAIDHVLDNATRSSNDLVRVYTPRIYARSAQLRPKESLALGKEVVAKLGVKLPSKPGIVSFLVGFFRVKRKLGKMDDDAILNLPNVYPYERNHIGAMTILSMMATCTYPANKTELYAEICFAMIKISLKHGLSAMSSHAFSLLAVVHSAMDDHEGAHRYSMLALKIVERYSRGKSEWLPRVSATVYGLVIPWSKPVAPSFDPLLNAHAIGRSSGDIEFAVLAGHFHGLNSWACGRPLKAIEKSHAAFYKEMVELKHETWLNLAAIHLQFFKKSDWHSRKSPIAPI